MKKLLALIALMFAVPAAWAAAPAPVYCIAGTLTPCSSTTQVGNGSQGDIWWKGFGKVNDIGNALSLFGTWPPPNGSLLIGNGSIYVPGTLTAGANITITNGPGSITIASAAGMVYPGAGLANSTGTAWSTSITTLAGLDSVLGITGTPSSTTYLRGDGTWATPSGSGTVNSGTSGQVGCYATTGTAISGCGLANGLAINSGTLGISEPTVQESGTSYTVDSTWCGTLRVFTSASSVAVSLPELTGCQIDFSAQGAGALTITSTAGTINGSGSALTVATNRQATLNYDSTDTNWGCIGCTALVAGGGSGQPQDIQTFTTSGTWTKPAWASADANATTKAICIGGGGGGGSGSVEPSGTAAPGGGGGGGGATADMLFQTSALAATVPVTVGLGGTGGIARTSTSNGQNGGNGGSSSFSTLTAPGGGYGSGGGTGTSTSGGGGAGILTGGSGGTSGTMCSGASSTGTGSGGNPGCPTGGAGGGGDQSSGSGGSAGGPTFAGGAGGGAGGGLTTASAASTGGAGGAVASATGPAGGATCTAGTAGTNGGAYGTGSAGSGGGSCATAATNAGTGGNGGTGSGGGGGGANINGDGNSGAGGNGGNGECIAVTSY